MVHTIVPDIQKTGNAEIDDFVKRLNLKGSVNTFAEIRTGMSAIKKEIENAVGLNVQLKPSKGVINGKFLNCYIVSITRRN